MKENRNFKSDNIKIVLADFRRLKADLRRTLYDYFYLNVLFNNETNLICEICGKSALICEKYKIVNQKDINCYIEVTQRRNYMNQKLQYHYTLSIA
jgi:hypothetical protein